LLCCFICSGLSLLGFFFLLLQLILGAFEEGHQVVVHYLQFREFSFKISHESRLLTAIDRALLITMSLLFNLLNFVLGLLFLFL